MALIPIVGNLFKIRIVSKNSIIVTEAFYRINIKTISIPINDHFAKHGKIKLQLKRGYSFTTFVEFEPSRFWGVDVDGKNPK